MNLLYTLLYEKELRLIGGIYDKIQVDFSFNSNRIEGSRLTYAQTESIFELKTITAESADIDDIFETVNHFKCFDNILDNLNQPLSEEYIKNLHKVLKTGVSEESASVVIGEYKKYPNGVGNILTASPSDVSEQMKLLIEKDSRNMTFSDIISFHAEFEKIHPFYDGNGRTGRLLMFRQCLANNIIPFLISADAKQEYYKGLQECHTKGDKKYLTEFCLEMQKNMKDTLNYFDIAHDDTKA